MKTDLNTGQLDQLIKSLRSHCLHDLADALQGARLSIVDAPEIGCMAVVFEHCCEIEVLAGDYARLAALSNEDRQVLLEAVQQIMQPLCPDLNLALVEIYRRD